MAATQKLSLFSALNALATGIQTEKTAAAKPRAKQADNPVPSDPGGYQGASTHPTASVDNRGQTASEGSRSSENESDVNADQPLSVNKAPDAKDGQSSDVNLNIGMQQSATGEDPSVEDDYKGGKDDPGSTMPARTDNDALDGHKYAGATIAQCYDLHTELANGILADLANGQGAKLTKQALAAAAGNMNPSPAGTAAPTQPKTQMAGQPPAGQKVAGAHTPNMSEMIEKAATAVRNGNMSADSPASANPDLEAGYELATLLGVEKRAAQAVVAELIEGAINDAQTDADMFGSFYKSFLKKSSDGGEGEDHSSEGDDTSGANGAEGTGGETGGGGGGDAGGPPGGDAGGGGSLGDLLGGGSDPGGMMGGGAPGGDPMGGASEQEALMQLAAALDELGIPLDQLAAAGAGGGGGMGGDPMGGGMPPPPGGGMPPGGGLPPDPMAGGMPPGGGGMPPPPGGGMPPEAGGGMGEGMKLASAVLAFKRSGQYRFKAANDGSRDRIIRDNMKRHLLELFGR